MKRSIGLWQFLGFGVTALGGTLLHFLYEWLDGAIWIAPFAGVNESTWEHMKLLFWPMLLFALIERFFFRKREDFWCVKARGILLGLILIPVIFYTYNGVLGKSPDWINIAIFFLSAAIAYIYEARLLQGERAACKSQKTAVAFLALFALCFIVFTFAAPKLPLFQDPLSKGYGIS